MPNFFYFDQNNQKCGPVNEQQLKALAVQGVINPNTPLMTDTGHQGLAGQIPGLFAATPPPFIAASTPQMPSHSPQLPSNFTKPKVLIPLGGCGCLTLLLLFVMIAAFVSRPATEYITIDDYNRIQTGMSYDEVVSIVGEPTEVLSESEYGFMCMWIVDYSTGANFNVTFVDGEVLMKAQFGMR